MSASMQTCVVEVGDFNTQHVVVVVCIINLILIVITVAQLSAGAGGRLAGGAVAGGDVGHLLSLVGASRVLPLGDEDERHDQTERQERAERRAERHRQRVGRRRATDARPRVPPQRRRRLAARTGSGSAGTGSDGRLAHAQDADVVVGVLVQVRDVVRRRADVQ